MDAPASFEFAKELTTQLITLSTAVIGVSATFAKDVSTNTSKPSRVLLYVSWIVFLVSLVCGLWTLGSMTGTLAKVSPIKADSVYAPNIVVASLAQVLLFLTGVLLLIIHAVTAKKR